MVALLAVIQILLGSRLSQAQDLKLNQDRRDGRTLEEALDVAGQDIGGELEELFKQLESKSEKFGQKFERWAEENSDELSAWSEKYGDQWQEFGERMNRTMESLAQDRQGLWSQWAESYERDLKQWDNSLQQDELTGENIGRFIDDNLEALSKMPLKELVGEALEDGTDEFRNAPWESLEELGLLAKEAMQESVGELTIERAKAKRAFDRSTKKLTRALDRLNEDIAQNISDEANSNRTIDIPRGDQILEKVEREKQRRAFDEFNMDLQRSSQDSREAQIQKSNAQWQTKDSRATQRPDGKYLDSPLRSKKTDQIKFYRDGDGRQPRTQKQKSFRPSNRNSNGGSAEPEAGDRDELLRQIEELRQEVENLKRNRS